MMATGARAAQQTAAAEEYSLLEARPRNWRKQLWLKGRSMTVGQLVYSMRASGLLNDVEAAARNFALPPEQMRQALDYHRRHRDLVEQDAEEEKRWLLAQGHSLEPRR